MKPERQPFTVCDAIIREVASWMAVAVVRDFDGSLEPIRAGVQESRRRQQRDCPECHELSTNLDELARMTHRLGRRTSRMRNSGTLSGRRGRIDPEAEVEAALRLVGSAAVRLRAEDPDPRPRVSCQPGVIGAAVIHLLMRYDLGQACDVILKRTPTSCLEMTLMGTMARQAAHETALHLQAAQAAVDRLGGSLDAAPPFRVCMRLPLEL